MIDYFKKKEFVRWLVVVITVINVASLGTIIYLTWDKPQKKKRVYDKRHHAFSFLQKKLNLTEVQQTEIRDFQDQHFESTYKLHEKISSLKKKLYEEISKPNSDSLIIDSSIKKMTEYNAQLERAMVMHFGKMKSVLTDSQKVHFKKLMKRLKKKKRHHWRKKRAEKRRRASREMKGQ